MIILHKYYDNSCPQGNGIGFSYQFVIPDQVEDLDQLDLVLCALQGHPRGMG